jgi:hypothetical protein
MKGALWAWEALQCLLKVAAEYSDLLKIWARIEQWDSKTTTRVGTSSYLMVASIFVKEN